MMITILSSPDLHGPQVLEIFYVGLSVRTSEVCRVRQLLPWVQWTLWRDKVRGRGDLVK